MISFSKLGLPNKIALSGALCGIGLALLGSSFTFGVPTSAAGQILRQGVSCPRLQRWLSSQWSFAEQNQPYQAQVFSRDPLVIYIRSFLSPEEVSHLLQLSEGQFEPSKVYLGYEESSVDLEMRDSESAHIDRADAVVRRVERRAMQFQGWRGKSTVVEHPTVQRYRENGFYNYHYDWDPSLEAGNRVTTFNVYLVGDCTGGGTNFPFLPQPNDTRWCDVIECSDEGRDGYQGVTFKPIAGSAVFWENLHPNGSTHKGVYHAGLPVKSGVKVGLNLWSWDSSWTSPDVAA